MQQRDLPVSVDLDGVLADEVVAWVETEAGWQVVAAGGPPTPALHLCATPRPGVASVVVVDGAPSPDVVRGALLAGALDVVGWPADRTRLLDAPARVRASSGPAAGSVVRVAGAAGGTGTSTVALALGALAAWRGRRALVVGDEDLLPLCGIASWAGPGAGELASLPADDAAAEAAALARPVPGVPGLAVLGGGAAAIDAVSAWPAEVVIADVRATPGLASDVLVARPDVSLRSAARTAARRVVVCGAGPLDPRGVRAVLGAPPAGWLPASARVGLAGVHGRVPSALPGTWVAALRTAVAGAAR